MKIMRENDVKIFEELVKMEQDQLLKTLFTFLKKNYEKISCSLTVSCHGSGPLG